MNKIFRYELRRLLLSKLFLGLTLVMLWYALRLLRGTVILGVSNTAPFSPWSFGYYLSGLLPLMSGALLFCMWSQCGANSRAFGVLTDAAPVRRETYALIKCGAVMTAWSIMALLAVVLGLGFLISLFGSEVPVLWLLLTALVALLPPLVFQCGLGLLLGRTHPALTALPLVIALVLSLAPVPMEADIFGASFFAKYPLMLSVLDPPLMLPSGVAAARIGFTLIGVFCLAAVRKARLQN